MKKTILVGLLLLLPFCFALADNSQSKLVISPEMIDIGKVQRPQVLERIVTLQNTNNIGLVVKSITVDCPCTSFQIKNGDKYEDFPSYMSLAISSGSSIEFKLIFDSSKTKYVGKFTKYIVISSTDPEWPVKRIKIIGEIEE